jgi:hypothetical protein
MPRGQHHITFYAAQEKPLLCAHLKQVQMQVHQLRFKEATAQKHQRFAATQLGHILGDIRLVLRQQIILKVRQRPRYDAGIISAH